MGIGEPDLRDARISVSRKLDVEIEPPGARGEDFDHKVRNPLKVAGVGVRLVAGPEKEDVRLDGRSDLFREQDIHGSEQNLPTAVVEDEVVELPEKPSGRTLMDDLGSGAPVEMASDNLIAPAVAGKQAIVL
ncbi:MAG TPA: hypothetical protein VL025_02045, partial [Thermoanaerobaculia bacterium]|nr:hypothetical protein [Thermoanaerobaculia bacterium]